MYDQLPFGFHKAKLATLSSRSHRQRQKEPFWIREPPAMATEAEPFKTTVIGKRRRSTNKWRELAAFKPRTHRQRDPPMEALSKTDNHWRREPTSVLNRGPTSEVKEINQETTQSRIMEKNSDEILKEQWRRGRRERERERAREGGRSEREMCSITLPEYGLWTHPSPSCIKNPKSWNDRLF